MTKTYTNEIKRREGGREGREEGEEAELAAIKD